MLVQRRIVQILVQDFFVTLQELEVHEIQRGSKTAGSLFGPKLDQISLVRIGKIPDLSLLALPIHARKQRLAEGIMGHLKQLDRLGLALVEHLHVHDEALGRLEFLAEPFVPMVVQRLLLVTNRALLPPHLLGANHIGLVGPDVPVHPHLKPKIEITDSDLAVLNHGIQGIFGHVRNHVELIALVLFGLERGNAPELAVVDGSWALGSGTVIALVDRLIYTSIR